MSNLVQASDSLLWAILKAPQDKFDRASATLKNRLTKNWTASQEEALGNVFRALRRDPAPLPTKESMDRLVKSLETELGAPLGEAVRRDLQKVIDLTYEAGAKDISGAAFSFNLTDERALTALEKHHVYWVGAFYNRNLGERVAALGTQVIEEGLTKTQAGQLFKQTLGTELKKGTDAYWKNFANNTVTRSRTMGDVSGLEFAGAVRYEFVAILDKLTSDVCREMNGKIFEVARAVKQRDRIIDAVSPDDIRTIAPWPKIKDVNGLTADQMPPGAIMPPLHFGCRSRIVIYD